jgi:putative peptidoglycan lipid II flippase
VTANGGQGLSFRAIGRSALILTGAAAGGQLLGVVREVFVATNVGISLDYDALLIALVVPAALAGVLTSGTVTAMVPAYIQIRDNRGREEARRFAGSVGVWVGLGGLAAWLGLEVFGAVAIAIGGPGLGPVARDSALGYLHLVAPLAFVSGISGVLYGVCQAEERFAAIAWSGFAGSATTLATILGLWHWLQLGALALGSVAGPIVGASVLLASTMRGSITPRPTLWTSRDELTAFAHHAVPLTFSSAILQVNPVVDRAVASLLAPGAVSALRYADVLVRSPIGAISPAWGTALYPALVRAAQDTGAGLAAATERAIRYVLAVFVPVAVLTAAVAPVAVAVLYERGAFGALDVDRTARAVAAFAPLIVIVMCLPALTGAFNARRRGSVLLAGGSMNVLLNAVTDVAFGIWLGGAGVALSSSVTAMVVAAFFVWRLSELEERFALTPIVRTGLLALLASLLVAAPIAVLSWARLVPSGTIIALVALVAFGVVGILGYLIVALWLGLDEARAVVRLCLEWYARRRGAGSASR